MTGACWRALRVVAPVATSLLTPAAGYGIERVPRSGGAVVAANHFSSLDPFLIGAFSPRTIHFMAKAELFAKPLLGTLVRALGAFPVERNEGCALGPIRHGRRLVAGGAAVGLFVEGARQRIPYPEPARPGAALIAMQEGVPVVPCGVASFGARVGGRSLCAVVFGAPIDLEGFPRARHGYRNAADVLTVEIVRLWQLAAEAVAAGLPQVLSDGTPRDCRRRQPASASEIIRVPCDTQPTRRASA